MLKLAVFGCPIAHSQSPEIHQGFAKQVGIEIEYEKILAPKENFKPYLYNFVKLGGNGCNITVPFKNQAHQLCHHLSQNAQLAEAVNTIKIIDDQLMGENTDGKGLINDLTHNLDITLQDKVILILGAGGATQGILYPLLQQHPKQVMIANRTVEKAIKLAQQFSIYGKTCGFGLDKIKAEPVDIIINATSASLDNNNLILPNALAKDSICYDLVYNKQTLFMDWAKQNQAKQVFDGLGMLIEQAALSFEYWSGKKPRTDALFKQFGRTHTLRPL